MTEELIEEKKLRTKKPKMIPVKVIKGSPDNSMVEFEIGGLLQRATIPNNIIEDGKCPEDELEFGIPFGVAWENVILSVNSIRLATMLRRMDIWTKEDAMNNPKSVIAALQAVYGCDLAALVKYARDNS